MAENTTTSWVRRTNFSHTVYHRLDLLRFPAIPLCAQVDCNQESKKEILSSNTSELPSGHISLDSNANLEKQKPSNTKLHSSSSLPAQFLLHDESQKTMVEKPGKEQVGMVSHKSGMSRNKTEWYSKPKQRSSSPLPTLILSDTFKEARIDGRRFSTPPPSRGGSDKGVIGKLLSREARDHRTLNSMMPSETSSLQYLSPKNVSVKLMSQDTAWARYLDHGGRKVSALDVTDDWMVDLSKLYLGLRFASGAHSRLYHGIYKDQPVAVKIIRQPDYDETGEMSARLEKQFTREVTLLSHLYHPNVIKLVGACRKPPVFCIITEYLSGGSLRVFLHKMDHESLALPRLIAIALDIARGMEYIHSQGVIHRDLKPENILFDQDFCVKIADLGIACEEAYCDTLTEDPGTYRWMAPEMIKQKTYGHKVDVYSFGLVLWEMVTGTMPYQEMTPIQAAFAVVDKKLRPTIPPGCPAALEALIKQCWSSHPEKRPEFWQIVKVLEQFESAITQDGTLDQISNLTSQEHKKRLLLWIQKLKPLHSDEPLRHQLMPKLL